MSICVKLSLLLIAGFIVNLKLTAAEPVADGHVREKRSDDWLTSIWDYFYDEESDESETHLICRNCTVNIAQSTPATEAPVTSTTNTPAPNTMKTDVNQRRQSVRGGDTQPAGAATTGGATQPAGADAAGGAAQSAGAAATGGATQPAGAAATEGGAQPAGAATTAGAAQPAGAAATAGASQPAGAATTDGAAASG